MGGRLWQMVEKCEFMVSAACCGFKSEMHGKEVGCLERPHSCFTLLNHWDMLVDLRCWTLLGMCDFLAILISLMILLRSGR